jgi:hypothetical protein
MEREIRERERQRERDREGGGGIEVRGFMHGVLFEYSMQN